MAMAEIMEDNTCEYCKEVIYPAIILIDSFQKAAEHRLACAKRYIVELERRLKNSEEPRPRLDTPSFFAGRRG